MSHAYFGVGMLLNLAVGLLVPTLAIVAIIYLVVKVRRIERKLGDLTRQQRPPTD